MNHLGADGASLGVGLKFYAGSLFGGSNGIASDFTWGWGGF
jgi:hypothetical protein